MSNQAPISASGPSPNSASVAAPNQSAQSAHAGAATQEQPVSAPTQEQLASDPLLRLVHIDIPTERRRLKSIDAPTPQQCMMELHGTTLDLVEDLAKHVAATRAWAYDYMTRLSEHIEAHEDRFDVLDQYGSETAITPEDAETLLKAVLGCKLLATQFLQGPFPISERDEEGKQKLAELIVFAEQAEKVISDNTLVPDDDEDEGVDDEPVESDGVGPS